MRMFLSVFGLDATAGVSVSKVAAFAAKSGFAVIPIVPGGKEPLCTLAARDRAKDPDHACGLKHVITDPAAARRIFDRLGKSYDRPLNLAIVPGPSRILSIDTDTVEQVTAFQRAVGAGTPTVRSPGVRKSDGAWVHKDGGHYHYVVPDDVELPTNFTSYIGEGNWVAKWGDGHYLLVPPSIREEGPYVATGDLLPVPQALLDILQQESSRREDRRTAAANIVYQEDDPVQSWSRETDWDDLLTPAGWTFYRTDRCGCPAYTRPGGDVTARKSATAHEPECDVFENREGHGPLYIWSDTAAADLGSRTLTKLQFYAAIHEMELGEAIADLGLYPELSPASMIWASHITKRAKSVVINSVDDKPVTTENDIYKNPYLPADIPTNNMTSKVVGDGGDSIESSPPPTFARDNTTTNLNGVINDCTTSTFFKILRRKTVELFTSTYGVEPSDDDVQSIMKQSERHFQRAITGDLVKDVRAVMQAGGLAAEDVLFPDSEWFEKQLSTDVVNESPDVLKTTSGRGLFYRGRTNLVVGPRNSGKTFVAILAAIEILSEGGSVFYADLEDTFQAWRGRFYTLGYPEIDDAVRNGRAIWTPLTSVSSAVMDIVVSKASKFDLAVFDVWNRLVVAVGGDPNNAASEIDFLYGNLFSPIARAGSCVVVLDHPAKAGSTKKTPTYSEAEASGSALKLNHLDGLALSLSVVRPLSRDNPNCEIDLICHKDRHGNYTAWDSIAKIVGSMNISDDAGIVQALTVQSIQVDEAQAEALLVEECKSWIINQLLEHGATKNRDLQQRVLRRLRPSYKTAVASLMADNVLSEVGTTFAIRVSTPEEKTSEDRAKTDIRRAEKVIYRIVSDISTGIQPVAVKALLPKPLQAYYANAVAGLEYRRQFISKVAGVGFIPGPQTPSDDEWKDIDEDV